MHECKLCHGYLHHPGVVISGHNQSEYTSPTVFPCRKENIQRCHDRDRGRRRPINSIHRLGWLHHRRETHHIADWFCTSHTINRHLSCMQAVVVGVFQWYHFTPHSRSRRHPGKKFLMLRNIFFWKINIASWDRAAPYCTKCTVHTKP